LRWRGVNGGCATLPPPHVVLLLMPSVCLSLLQVARGVLEVEGRWRVAREVVDAVEGLVTCCLSRSLAGGAGGVGGGGAVPGAPFRGGGAPRGG